MQFTCLRQYLFNILTIAERATKKNAALPVLQHALLRAEKTKISVSATDLEIGVQASCQAKVTTGGSVVVPVRTLLGFLTYTNEEKISFSLDGTALTVHAGTSRATVNGSDAKEFPLMPEVEKDFSASYAAQDIFPSLAALASFCATSDVRPELSGVYCVFEPTQLRMAATDSFRLGERIIPVQTSGKTYACIMPSRTVLEASRLAHDTGDMVHIVASRHQILFKMPERELVSRLIEGKYPDYQTIIPPSFSTNIQIHAAAFSQALHAAGVFSGKNNEVRLAFSPAKGHCVVTSKQSDVGEHTNTITCTGEGADVAFLCNYKYILDALSGLSDEMVFVGVNRENEPVLMRGAVSAGARYVVVPLRSS